MEPFIYVPGDFADDIGQLNLQQLAQYTANLAGKSVSIVTLGDSEFHADRRYRARPDGSDE